MRRFLERLFSPKPAFLASINKTISGGSTGIMFVIASGDQASPLPNDLPCPSGATERGEMYVHPWKKVYWFPIDSYASVQSWSNTRRLILGWILEYLVVPKTLPYLSLESYDTPKFLKIMDIHISGV